MKLSDRLVRLLGARIHRILITVLLFLVVKLARTSMTCSSAKSMQSDKTQDQPTKQKGKTSKAAIIAGSALKNPSPRKYSLILPKKCLKAPLKTRQPSKTGTFLRILKFHCPPRSFRRALQQFSRIFCHKTSTYRSGTKSKLNTETI